MKENKWYITQPELRTLANALLDYLEKYPERGNMILLCRLETIITYIELCGSKGIDVVSLGGE